jgi:dolichyl-diphosphooligosaccharide--protein glycosyltransferase
MIVYAIFTFHSIVNPSHSSFHHFHHPGKYLYAHGRKKFFQWFDYMSWYPLGRPVGTTIYPGLQFTAVWVKNHIVGDSMSLNDVCCYIPAWFGVVATFVTGLIAYESSLECNSSTNIFQVLMDIFVHKGDQSKNTEVAKHQSSSVPIFSFLCTMAAMAVMPAHLMRSVGGGFDNESIAISAMVMTFYFWVRSLRNGDDKSHWFGILTGVSYFYVSICFLCALLL